MSSSLDQTGGHYALTSNSQPNPNDHSNNSSNSNSGNNNNGQYGLGYSGQQQQQQRHPHQNYHRTQQPMFYAQQEYHQQQGMYPQQGSSPHQHQQPRHTNDQYSQQQDLSRQNHYNQQQQQQQPQHSQQSFSGYNQQGQQSHYQASSPSSSGRSHYTQAGQGHGGHEHDSETGYSKEKEQESGSASASGSLPPESGPNNLRFKITLEAPTAAMQRQDETSLTYLNKAQFYTIGLEDTEEYNGEITSVIKVTFHEPSHRRLAARYWSFWLSQQQNPKTARALDIEKASSSGILEVQSKTFDRISFKWNGKSGAKLMVRFNCLSTDFSRIKGVKGIPLRVHMDTYLDSVGEGDRDGSARSHDLSDDSTAVERAFAKIKLFRDKGAERKNKDDHKQLEKMWDKMRGKNADTNPLINMLAPVQSVSLFAECMDPPEGSGEEETLDLSETLTHDSQGKGSNNGSGSGRQEAGDGGNGSDGVESYSSRQDGDSMSTASAGDQPTSLVVSTKKRRRNAEEDVEDDGQSTYEPHQSQVGFVSSVASLPATITSGAGEVVTSSSGSDLLLDRDMNYVPMVRKKRPVLCLYIKIGGEAVYRAVYLEKCTLADLIQKLSEKLEIQSSTISHVFRKTLKKELIVRVDDAMVGQMADELDMVVEYDFNQQDGSVNLTLKY